MNLPLETRAFAWALLAAALSLGSALLLASPIERIAANTPAAEALPPAIAASPELVAQGHEFFDQSCADCHGDDAHGDEGPDLHNLAISNARIASQIKNGVKGEMPSFAKKYDERQVAGLISYLRTLR